MKKVRLGDHLRFTRGTSLSGDYYATSGEYVRLTLGNFDFKENRFKENKTKKDIYFTGSFKPAFLLSAGDVITPLTEQTRGLLGSTACIPDSGRYILSQDIAKIESLGGDILLSYAYFLFPSAVVRKQLDAGSQQTKIRHTSVSKLEDLIAFVPSLKEQNQIASFLSCLDSLIDCYDSQIQELEKTAQDIYDYWFVQYDFPDENGNPYRASGGKMVWNDALKCEIPDGWGDSHLGKYFKVIMGQSPPGSSLNDCGIGTEFYQGATYFGRFFPANSSWSTEPSRFAQEGDVLLSVRAPVGKWNIALNPCAIGRGLSAISPSSGGLFYLLGTIRLLMPILERMNNNGTTYGSINSSNLRGLPVLEPPADLIIKFETHTQTMKEQIFSLEKSRRELDILKQTLLPLLLNGQASFKPA